MYKDIFPLSNIPPSSSRNRTRPADDASQALGAALVTICQLRSGGALSHPDKIVCRRPRGDDPILQRDIPDAEVLPCQREGERLALARL